MLSSRTVRFLNLSSCCLSKVTAGPSDALRRRVGARRRRVALEPRPLLAPAASAPSRRAVRLPVARHGRRAEGLARAARRRAVLLLLGLFLLRRRGGAEGPAVLAPRGAEAPLGLRACLGHRGRSAGSRSAVASLLFAAVRAWRSSQAFPVKRRGPRLARVAGCREPRGSPGRRRAAPGARLHKICFRDCRRARLFLAGAAPRGYRNKAAQLLDGSSRGTPSVGAPMQGRAGCPCRLSTCEPQASSLIDMEG